MELREHYSFILEGQKLHILMITHGTITAAVPRHSHSKNSYEIRSEERRVGKECL